MFHRNDKVVYANYGVCTVSETDAHMLLGGVERTYYVLTPTRARGGTVYVPADHEELMRPIMARSDALALVEGYGDIRTDDFTDNNARTVESHFKQLLKRCDCATALCVVKTMRTRIADQERRKHLPSSMYTRLLDQASHQASSELSAALGIAEDDLEGFFEAHAEQARTR